MPTTVDFTTDFSSLSFPTNTKVGSIYEVAINGSGYMLYDQNADNPDFKYQRSVIPLDADRLVTSPTPLSESVQRYLFSGLSDWKGGAGQVFADRKEANPDAFWISDGVDVTIKNKLTLLNSMSREYTQAYSGLRLATVGTSLYAITAAKQLTYNSAPGVAGSNFNVAAAVTLSDIAGDGTNWYACDGVSVWRNNTNADPGGAWSAIPLQRVGWGAGRVVGSYQRVGGTTPNTFTTLADAGTEEVANGRLTLQPGWTIQSFCAGSGHVFFCAFKGDQGAVYSWDVTTAAPIVAWQLPKGEIPLACTWSQGNVMVLAKRAMGSVSRLALYRGEVQQNFSLSGTLIPTLITVVGYFENPPAHDYGLQPSITAFGNLVFWSWPYMSGNTASGVGMLDLSTSAWTRWYKATVGGQIGSIDIWQGRVVFSVIGDGVWTQNVTSYVSTGYVQGSLIDGDSTLDKVFDTVALSSASLAASESFNVDYTIDLLGTYTNIPAATMAATGQHYQTSDINVRSPNLGIKVTLNGPGTSTPTLYSAVVRYHPLGLGDVILQLPIDCGDLVKGLNDQDLAENAPGAGAARARYFQSLIQTRCLVQDVDWLDTQLVETYEVLQVQISKWSVYERGGHKNRLRMVAVVTLRTRGR